MNAAAPSSSGKDFWFSTKKLGFEFPWGHQAGTKRDFNVDEQ